MSDEDFIHHILMRIWLKNGDEVSPQPGLKLLEFLFVSLKIIEKIRTPAKLDFGKKQLND